MRTNRKTDIVLIILQVSALFLFVPFVSAQGETKEAVNPPSRNSSGRGFARGGNSEGNSASARFSPRRSEREDSTGVRPWSFNKKAGMPPVTALEEKKYEENLKLWQSLSEEERRVIRERAKRLSPERIKEFREKSERFRSMPKEEQDKIRNNYQRFNKMPVKEREVLRERYRRFENFLPEKREKLRQQLRERKDMPLGCPAEGLRIPRDTQSRYPAPDFNPPSRLPAGKAGNSPPVRVGMPASSSWRGPARSGDSEENSASARFSPRRSERKDSTDVRPWSFNKRKRPVETGLPRSSGSKSSLYQDKPPYPKKNFHNYREDLPISGENVRKRLDFKKDINPKPGIQDNPGQKKNGYFHPPKDNDNNLLKHQGIPGNNLDKYQVMQGRPDASFGQGEELQGDKSRPGVVDKVTGRGKSGGRFRHRR